MAPMAVARQAELAWGRGVAMNDRWLRLGGGCGVAAVAERGFRDYCGL
jgi:hypothetical protein